MAIGPEVETMEPEVEENPDVEYIKKLSTKLLDEINHYLVDHPTALNLEDVRAKLQLYSEGDFSLSSVDFTCLGQMVDFVVKRRGREREFEADIDRLAEVRTNLQKV